VAVEELQVEPEFDQNEEPEYSQNPQFEILEYQDEEYIVEVKEPEADEGEIKIKQENIEDEDQGDGIIKSEPMELVECKIDEGPEINLYQSPDDHQFVNPEVIVKVEPIDYDYSDLEHQNHTTEMDSQDYYLPMILNPRTVPSSQNLKRKISDPQTSNSPKIVKASLRSALESSKHHSFHAPKKMKFPQKSLKCQYCPQRFDNCDLILEHIEEKHKFQCPVCYKSFPFKINLVRHQFSDHKESTPKEQKNGSQKGYKHACNHCMMKFSVRENLDIHIMQEHNVHLKGLGGYGDDQVN